MTPEERDLLSRAVKLAEENNQILKGIRRRNRLSTLWRIIYWTAIIALTYGTFVYLEPYISQLRSTFDTIQNDVGSLKDATSKIPTNITDLLNR